MEDLTDRGLPHVVIVGAGFAGIYAARELRKAPVRITVIDRTNYHLFQPLLYQVATAALSAGDIAYPIRTILRGQKNARVLLGEVREIDKQARRVVLDRGELHYDFLILATGATHSYFGNDQWAERAPGLKTVEDALEIRKRVYLAYEAAERESDPARQCEWLTFVVVGAGPTGVELAGALAEIGLKSLTDDFKTVDPTNVRVVLVEGVDRVLPSYPPELSAKAQAQLERLGVEVRLESMVSGIDEHGVQIGDERIAARTVLWAAGVQASPLAKTLDVPLDRAGRVLIRDTLDIPDRPEVFVVGDLASLTIDGEQVPGVAQGAIQMGKHAARNIRRRLSGEAYAPFRYKDKGSMATIGRAAAIAQVGRLELAGVLAWLLWLFVHILFIIGFRNRVAVLFGWAWQYLTWQRTVRLISAPLPELPEVVDRPEHVAPAPAEVTDRRAADGQDEDQAWSPPEERISESVPGDRSGAEARS